MDLTQYEQHVDRAAECLSKAQDFHNRAARHLAEARIRYSVCHWVLLTHLLTVLPCLLLLLFGHVSPVMWLMLASTWVFITADNYAKRKLKELDND